jgi:predicted permease
VEDLVRDLRHSGRYLLRRPVFTAVAVLSLALGIGANTAIFSVINALFLRTLPVAEPDRLVALFTKDVKNPGFAPISHLNWKDYRDMSRSFSGVLGYTWTGLSVQTGGEPAVVIGQLVSGNYFDVLGIKARYGHTFRPEEDGQPGAHPVAVVSHRFWQENLNGDPAAIGRKLTINGSGYTLIGVAPEGFDGIDVGGQPRIWIPFAMNRQILPNDEFNFFDERRPLVFFAYGRLRPGITLSQAQAEVATIAKRLQRDYPDDNKGRSIDLVPLTQAVINPQIRQGVVAGTGLLMAVVGLVLLIACANVSNLLLAQAVSRRREIAIRLSQGALRGRLVRQLLTESVVLALLGGALGLLIALWAQQLLPKLLPAGQFPLALDLGLDGRVLAFTLGLSLFVGVLFGLIPALQASKPELVSALKNEAAAQSGVARALSLRGLLVAGQVALSLVSLIAAGLFLRSLREAQRIDPGYDASRLAMLSFDVALQGWNQPRGEQFFRDVRERAASLPGVAAATLAQAGPFQGAFFRSIFLEGGDATHDGTFVQVNPIGPDYFATLGIPLVRGRAFSDADRKESTRVVIVNETMAKKLWPGRDPVGKRFHFFGDPWVEVVGVARDAKYNFPGEDPQPYAYEPLTQRYVTNVTLVVRAEQDPEAAIAAVQREVRGMAPGMPLVGVGTAPSQLDDALWAPRAGASLLAIFGFLALLLASVGLYGVMAFSVSQRSREIGVRMALGAHQRDVLRLVLRQGLTLVAVGLVVGLAAAFGVTRFVANLLIGVSPTDPAAFGSMAAILSLVAFFAILVPALKAVAVDPIVVLRYE